ncbi:MAG: primosomal protein N' [Candidatus Binatia bacterium]|nr:primosomal protein N' [Candidatus Binatia bacterium]
MVLENGATALSSTGKPAEPSEQPDPHAVGTSAPEGPIVQVALIPAQGNLDILDYVVPESLAHEVAVGSRVVVPLGRRFVMGVVIQQVEHSAAPHLRPISACLDHNGPLFDPLLLELARWLGEYYLGSLSEAIATMIPSAIKVRVRRLLSTAPSALTEVADPKDRNIVEHVARHAWIPVPTLRRQLKEAFSTARLERLCRQGILLVRYQAEASVPAERQGLRIVRISTPLPELEVEVWMQRRPALWRFYEYLYHHPSGYATLDELQANFPSARAKLRLLEEAGVIEWDRLAPEPILSSSTETASQALPLTAHQSEAVRQLRASLHEGFVPFLLFGVTGSGKTEVYLQTAEACLSAGKTVLALVPEISLTHQLVTALRGRFGSEVALLHSGLSPRERWQQWERIASGAVHLAVGARSAVFAPLRNLGLIIVDEEHDGAYKQEEGLRYHARDVAVMRARLANCTIVLGSATPSLESYYNARRGRYRLLHLPERIDTRPLPTVELIDLRGTRVHGRALPLSQTLCSALEFNLAVKQQSLLFLNRRGYARFLQCLECGAVMNCANCSVSLTYHQRKAALQCHHCGRTTPAPRCCPQCGGTAVAAWSAGTEQVEQVVRALLPHARVARLDRDVAARPKALLEILNHWIAGNFDILIGTQMVTKGHHVPNVTLVGVILADLSRNLPDFRSSERTFQLLTQVAGRAGRGDVPGRVLVQTYRPEDPVLQWAASQDYEGFARYELSHRQELAYPPFSRLVLARVEARHEEEAQTVAHQFAATVAALGGHALQVLGPAPAPLLRLRGWYRWQVLLRSTHSAIARRSAAHARTLVRERLSQKAHVRIVLDVDPQSLL